MGFISISNVSFGYNVDSLLLDGVSCVFSDSDRVAVVGDNGAGKSTLLSILNGDIEPDSGQCVRNATVHIVRQINNTDSKSGGECQAHALARAFDSQAEILLLDEPTNNLDTDARHRFFDDLMSYPFGAVIVSHDRELLKMMDKIIEISNGHIRVFGGNYDFWVSQKQIELASAQSQYVDATKEIARLSGTLNRAQNMRQHHAAKQKKDAANRASGSRLAANALKGKSQETEAKRRAIIQKKLNLQIEKQKVLSGQMRDEKIKIPVSNKSFYSKDLIFISELCFAYGDKRIFDKFNFVMSGGMRVRISGKNGCGKSTLLKLICGELLPDSGVIKRYGKIAYLNQDLSVLDKEKTVVENIMNIANVLKHDAHAIAANFGFRGDASRRRVGVLSGGELLKAILAAVLGGDEQPDLLILDEPTNNLEIKSIEILENAINQYQGAVLLVSHDDMFVQNVRIDTVMELL